MADEPRRCDFCWASGDDVKLTVIEDIPVYSPFDACADHDACMERMKRPHPRRMLCISGGWCTCSAQDGCGRT